MIKMEFYNNKQEDDDDEEDLEALRLAALKTLKKKSENPAPVAPLKNNVIYQKHNRHPNLITIVPVGSEPDNVFKPPPRVVTNPSIKFNVQGAKVTNTNPNNTFLKTSAAKVQEKDKEEVSTKFSRFEDTDSESEDDILLDNKTSEESSEESDADCIALQDDDSLEALMALMEQEINSDSENKSEKKKNKSSLKTKNKSSKVEEKTAVVQEVKPSKVAQQRTTSPVRVEVKPMKRSPVRNLSPQPYTSFSKTSAKKKSPSPVRKISPIRLKSPVRSPVHSQLSNKSKSPIRSSRVKSPIRTVRSQSPNRSKSPLRSPRMKSPNRKISSRSPPRRKKSPVRLHIKQKSPLSQSPGRRSPSPLRSYSPEKFSHYRKSPKRSPSPYSRVHRSRSPFKKRSHSPIARKERMYDSRNKDHSPRYISKSPPTGRRRSLTPKKWSPRHSPLRYRSPNQIRRSFSPKRPISRSPSPYYSPRRRSPSPKLKPLSYRRSRSPSPLPRRSLSPRRRAVSPRRREYYSPVKRSLSPKQDVKQNSISPRRKTSPFNKVSKYSPPRSPVRRHSVSPQRRRVISPQRSKVSSPQRKKVNSPQRRKINSPLRKKIDSPPRRKASSPQRQEYDKGRIKSEKPKSTSESRRAKNWSRSPSVSLSPSPPPRDREADDSSRRNKSPLRVQKGNDAYTKSDKRPRSPEIRNGNTGRADRRRAGRNWDRSNKSSDSRRKQDRDRRKDKESSKREEESEKPSVQNKSDPVVVDPVLEARRKKFESKDLVEPASKKIRLRNSPVREKVVERVEAQTEPEIVVKPEQNKVDDNDFDIDFEGDVLDLGAELWSSDDELIVKQNGNFTRKVIRPPSPKKKKPVKERLTLEKKKTKEKHNSLSTTSSIKVKSKDVVDKASSPLTIVQDKAASPDEKVVKDEVDSDLRAELSRRRAERLTKAGSVHKNLPARIVQSAFAGVMGKKKVKKTEKKEKESKSKERKNKSPTPVCEVAKVAEKLDGRRVLVLKRPAPVRLPQTTINVNFSEGDSSSGSESDEKYASPIKRKLPIHMRLGIPDDRRRHKVRKVKIRNRNQV